MCLSLLHFHGRDHLSTQRHPSTGELESRCQGAWEGGDEDNYNRNRKKATNVQLNP